MMNRILFFFAFIGLMTGRADAAVRDGNATTRVSRDARIDTTTSRAATSRAATTQPRRADTPTTTRATTSRTAATQNTTQSRAAITPRAAQSAATTASRSNQTRTAAPRTASRAATPVTARAAAENTATAETKTGAAYEQCKTAFFTCMDQFCTLKNDDYRRCACSDRIYDLTSRMNVLQDAGTQLTTFTENLDVVGMTAAQAAAMRNASEGENALISDKSASKALLQAIMNSIRGQDATVGGKFSDLNSINMSFDAATAFGTMDAASAVANYNGQSLYTAVYPQCRNLVRADCTDASLQRAINAYLMAIEQDCNTVQTAIENKQKDMKSAVREGSAMLDLARVENRQKHNSDDIAACIANVKAAVLSEEVCGANYHKCLDNGEFIDVSTGAPITGVVNFYQLKELLTFSDGVDAADQKLSKVSNNRQFVQNFEDRVKKFAKPALDKCTESADEVWAEYLDQALLDIYYAQTAKVDEIQQGCFDFISKCYENNDASITTAMKELAGTKNNVLLQPDKVALTSQMCTDYIDSCNNMFGNNIIKDYVQTRNAEDVKTACRAVVKQCFDQYGGSGFHNFYYPYSGLFTTAHALDWFTLYEYTVNPDGKVTKREIKSKCAIQANNIDACKEYLEEVFGGFDSTKGTIKIQSAKDSVASFHITSAYDYPLYGMYNIGEDEKMEMSKHRGKRPTGVATETYNQIIDILSTQCTNINGRFTEIQNIFELGHYGISNPGDNTDEINTNLNTSTNICSYRNVATDGVPFKKYGVRNGENMCPSNYALNVDTLSWGACLCWENGGRRSKNGTTPNCNAVLPISQTTIGDVNCDNQTQTIIPVKSWNMNNWCITSVSANNQVCALDEVCPATKDTSNTDIPEGIQ